MKRGKGTDNEVDGRRKVKKRRACSKGLEGKEKKGENI